MVRGLDVANVDRSVSPREDFFSFANGVWCKQNPVPAEYSRWGSFEQLAEENMKVLREILDAASAAPLPAGSVTQLVGDFWRCAMDSATIEAAGAAPLAEMLALAESAASGATPLAAALAHFHAAGVPLLFSVGDGADAKDSTRSIAQAHQGGLGLPDRDYYTDEKHAAMLAAYEKHVARMLHLLGDDEAAAAEAAAAVVALETKLAKAQLTRTERRDPDKTYNKTTLSALADSAPELDWRAYFAALHKPEPGDINVDCPAAIAVAVEAAKAATPAELRAYLRWHVVNAAAEYLSDAFYDADFDFYLKTLNGQSEQKPRWKRCLGKVNSHLGEALGQLYVARAFPGDAKARALAVVHAVRDALEARLKELPWLGEATRDKALLKMKSFGVKIGYPDVWKDYSTLALSPDMSYYSMVLACNRFEHKRSMDRVDAPVDRTQWFMPPQVVNAYYMPPFNEIVFPAAILQPPFFSPEADDAVNFGAMGAVVGHEMTHGFDDQGRKFDHQGNLQVWWTEDDAAEFMRRAAVQTAQAAAFVVHTEDVCEPNAGPFRLTGGRSTANCNCGARTVNGELTLGENVADLGGLKLALRAFKASSPEANNPPDEDGFTPTQRLFLSWAQVWRANIKAAAAALRLATDPHAPHTLRVNGPVSNIAEFHEAFGVKPGDAMWRDPEARVDIW